MILGSDESRAYATYGEILWKWAAQNIGDLDVDFVYRPQAGQGEDAILGAFQLAWPEPLACPKFALVMVGGESSEAAAVV
jgi:hypothetical protein